MFFDVCQCSPRLPSGHQQEKTSPYLRKAIHAYCLLPKQTQTEISRGERHARKSLGKGRLELGFVLSHQSPAGRLQFSQPWVWCAHKALVWAYTAVGNRRPSRDAPFVPIKSLGKYISSRNENLQLCGIRKLEVCLQRSQFRVHLAAYVKMMAVWVTVLLPKSQGTCMVKLC